MAHLQFTDVQDRPTEFLDLTSLTLDEFQQLVPPFEAAFQAHMAAWRLDGKPRTARQFSVYKNCPLPTPEDRLFNWLQVLGTTETSHIDQGVRHQFHPVVALLDVLETEQQPLAFILPRKRPLDALP
jgi:hypothetical protein